MQPSLVLERNLPQRVNGVDHAIREAGRRPDHHHGVVVNGLRHRLNVSPAVRQNRYAPLIQVHALCCLGKGWMGGIGHHHVADTSGEASLGAGLRTGGPNGEKDAF